MFVHVNPSDVHTVADAPIELSRQAVSTLSVFGFWVVVALACALTWALLRLAVEINRSD